MVTDITRHDVAIVGAGPIGLEVAFHLRRAGLDHVLLEKGALGQTITWFPRRMHFFSSNERIAICGFPLQTVDQQKATREEYLAYLRQVAMVHELRVRTFEPVVGIEPLPGGAAGGRQGEETGGRAGGAARLERPRFRVTTRPAAGERAYEVGSVVLATGGMDEPCRLGIPGEDLPHVSHHFDEPHPYFGRRVLIVGGGNSAVEAAFRCFQVGARVAISYRRPRFDPGKIKYWLLPELEGRLQRGELEGHFATVPVEIGPDHVVLAPADPQTGGPAPGERRRVPADAVLLLTGYRCVPVLLQQAGIELRGEDLVPVFDPLTMETNVPGIFVAGTATAGAQGPYKVFIENCHDHGPRIAAVLTGRRPPPGSAVYEMPES